MAPEQDLQTGMDHPAPEASPDKPRPARRSSRGRRGRGRRGGRGRAPRSDAAPPPETAEVEAAEPTTPQDVEGRLEQDEEHAAAVISTPEPEPAPLRETPSSHAPQRTSQPASKTSIQDAIEQVNEIIGSLKESLEQMDEVLELLEYFERQGQADEREIESLRRSLRQLQRPKEGGRHSHHGH